MEITGIIIKKLGESAGTSEKTGQPWKNAEFLFETIGQYKKHAKFKVRDGQYNLIARFDSMIGKVVTVSFEIEATKAKDKEFWFNELRAWGIAEYKPEQMTAEQSMNNGQAAAQEQTEKAKEHPFGSMMQHDAVGAIAKKLNEKKEEGDDLPF